MKERSFASSGTDELGYAYTDASGRYLLLVNGVQRLTVDVSATGYLPSQRSLDVAWQTYGTAAPIILLQPDANETFIDLANLSDIAVAEGSVVADDDGERQAIALIAPGTTPCTASTRRAGTSRPSMRRAASSCSRWRTTRQSS